MSESSFNFKRWAFLVIFRTRFRNLGSPVFVVSCSLCEHALDCHHLFGSSSDVHAVSSSIDDPTDCISLPSDFDLVKLISPCHHSRVVLSYIIRCNGLPISYDSFNDLQRSLFSSCLLPPHSIDFPKRELHHSGAIDVYSTSDRLYQTFVTMTHNGIQKTHCSSCRAPWRKQRACRHMREFDRMDTVVLVESDIENDEDEDTRPDDAPTTRAISKQRYSCTIKLHSPPTAHCRTLTKPDIFS